MILFRLMLSCLLLAGMCLYSPADARAQSTDDPATTPMEAPAADTTDAIEATDTTGDTPTVVAAPKPRFRVRSVAQTQSVTLGSNDPATGHKIKVSLTRWGAGVHNISLTDYFRSLEKTEPYVLVDRIEAGDSRYPFAARAVTIDGTRLDLQTIAWAHRPTPEPDTAVYTVTIEDGEGNPVLLILRQYKVEPGSYEILCRQQIENLTDRRLEVSFEQNGPVDVALDDTKYLADPRKYVAGYFNPKPNPRRTMIFVDDAETARTAALDTGRIWPKDGVPDDAELVWLGLANRYFALVVHPPVRDAEPDTPAGERVDRLTESFPVAGSLEVIGTKMAESDNRKATLLLSTGTFTLPPRDSDKPALRRLNLALFAGPKLSSLMHSEPYSVLNLDSIVRYELGCTWCTFQWLARLLLGFMRVLHDYVVFDWGVAIIMLVLVVRLMLHPITKKSQISMTRMGKQMGKLKPEIEKLQKKYGNDKARLQKEMAALYREAGISPAGMLGCLPMFLQMPIWVALYAMLFYAIELRHEPALYGFFQWISGDSWAFLADLSTYDNFIRIADGGFTLPLVGMYIPYTINILPILMGVFFFMQQKYMSPPPADEQQAQQQKIMRVMMLMFPVFLYAAPSGLTFYMLASSIAGTVDGYYVRQHIKREEEAGTLLQKKQPKPGGFFDRLRKNIAEKQQMVEEMQKKQQTGPRKDRKKKSR